MNFSFSVTKLFWVSADTIIFRAQNSVYDEHRNIGLSFEAVKWVIYILPRTNKKYLFLNIF